VPWQRAWQILGMRVVGIAGGGDKCGYRRQLGFDAVIDYKNDDVRGA
jgi:NADPH-dependent curcumin reductase CurA